MSGGDGDNSAADERDSDFNGSSGSKLRVNGGSGAGARAAGDSAGARLRRLRRCKSFSRAEEIVTEEEKQRRSQPDKPIHKPRDSIFSLTSGFTNYEGMVNWAFLLLSIGGARLLLENLNKYGIRVNPFAWSKAIYGYQQDGEFPVFSMLAYTNIPLLMALGLEKIILKNYIKARICMILHILNITHVLILPMVVIYNKYEQIGPASLLLVTMGRFLITGSYAILALKLTSYVHVNYLWRRSLVLSKRRKSNDETATANLSQQEGKEEVAAKQSICDDNNNIREKPKVKINEAEKVDKKPDKLVADAIRELAKGVLKAMFRYLLDRLFQKLDQKVTEAKGAWNQKVTEVKGALDQRVTVAKTTLDQKVNEVKRHSAAKIESWYDSLGYSKKLEGVLQNLGLLEESKPEPETDLLTLEECDGLLCRDSDREVFPKSGVNSTQGGLVMTSKMVKVTEEKIPPQSKVAEDIITKTSNFRTTGKPQREAVSGTVLVQYPDNLTVFDIYYFWFAPTLCYELNFPRSLRIRKMFLLRRACEVMVGFNLLLALIQQWIIPSVVNSLIPFSNMNLGPATERLLKLSIPNHLCWLIWFYLLFHSFLNTLAEIMQFADRNFYNDWWNSDNIVVFWKTWNLPVHRWCVRHLYKPVLSYSQGNKMLASAIVFFVSAFFHEYMVSVPLRIFKAYAFFGMMFQVPLMVISTQAEKHLGHPAGNVIVWLSLIIGQPLAVLMYYHDFVVEHYGRNVLESFGKIV